MKIRIALMVRILNQMAYEFLLLGDDEKYVQIEDLAPDFVWSLMHNLRDQSNLSEDDEKIVGQMLIDNLVPALNGYYAREAMDKANEEALDITPSNSGDIVH